MAQREEFVELVHCALFHLYEPDRLRQSPLVSLFNVGSRINAFSRLQSILVEEIEALEPQLDEAAHSSTWDIFELLLFRYVKQLTQKQVALQLGMSVRHLRRKEYAALEVLAARLWERFDLQEQSLAVVDESPRLLGEEGPENGVPTVREELQWLRTTPVEVPADLGQVLQGVLDMVAPALERLGVDVDVHLPDGLPALAVHTVALSQLLLNLVYVALHQMGHRGIGVSARPVSAGLEIVIQTQGGTACPFSDGDTAKLDLAAALADVCRGRLDITAGWEISDPSAFRTSLWLPSVGQIPVLVVDDNEDTLQLLRRYAAGTRYHIITTRDPEEVLALVTDVAPQIIVLDVMMPGVDGWKLLGQLRREPRMVDVPVVVCTILPQQEVALDLGATSFLLKPVRRQAFLAALDSQITRKG
jgi:CheY-like chemotaxis protein